MGKRLLPHGASTPQHCSPCCCSLNPTVMPVCSLNSCFRTMSLYLKKKSLKSHYFGSAELGAATHTVTLAELQHKIKAITFQLGASAVKRAHFGHSPKSSRGQREWTSTGSQETRQNFSKAPLSLGVLARPTVLSALLTNDSFSPLIVAHEICTPNPSLTSLICSLTLSSQPLNSFHFELKEQVIGLAS